MPQTLLLSFVFVLVLFGGSSTSFAQTTLQEKRVQVLEQRQAIQEKKEMLLKNREEKMEQRQTQRLELQERLQAQKEQQISKREEFKERLKTIKDQRKQALVERLDEKMAAINKNRVDRLTIHIEKLESLLNRLIEKATRAKTNGKDITEVESAIDAAQTAIEAARTAIVTQAAKEYTATITDESVLASSVGTIVNQLQQDLKTTHQTVVNAKQTVHTVIKELVAIKADQILPTTTPST